jgi:hypothetical protein
MPSPKKTSSFILNRTYALGKTFLYDIARINTYK